MALLRVFFGTNLKEIIIKAEEYKGHCWIKDVWASDEQILKKQYSLKGFEIDMEIITGTFKYGNTAYNLNINRQ